MSDETAVTPEEAKAAMLELMKSKRSAAKQRHDNVPDFNADPALSGFFEDREYDNIFDLLLTQKSTKGDFAGRDLVIPGNPDESAYYLQIVPGGGGVMDGRFSDEEVGVVKTWIESLAAPTGDVVESDDAGDNEKPSTSGGCH